MLLLCSPSQKKLFLRDDTGRECNLSRLVSLGKCSAKEKDLVSKFFNISSLNSKEKFPKELQLLGKADAYITQYNEKKANSIISVAELKVFG
jgi:hypothetical protein